jgi:hypothetical protein
MEITENHKENLDIQPSHTLYINNINEKIKLDGKMIFYDD